MPSLYDDGSEYEPLFHGESMTEDELGDRYRWCPDCGCAQPLNDEIIQDDRDQMMILRKTCSECGFIFALRNIPFDQWDEILREERSEEKMSLPKKIGMYAFAIALPFVCSIEEINWGMIFGG